MKGHGNFPTKYLNTYFKSFSLKNNGSCASTIFGVKRRSSSVAWDSAKPFQDIPSPLILPLVGTGWQFMPLVGRYKIDRQNESNKDLYKRFGSIVRMKFGSLDAVACYEAEDMKELLRNEGQYPFRFEFSSLKTYRELRKNKFSTTGLFVLNGKEWHDLRSKIQKHMLKPAAIRSYLEPMQDVARDFVQRMYSVKDSNNEVPDFLRELYKWSLESVAFVGLDARLGCFKSDLTADSNRMKIIDAVLAQFDCMNRLELSMTKWPLWKYFSTPTWKRFEKASDTFAEIAFKYINQSLERAKSVVDSDDKQLTLLQVMMANKDLSPEDAMVFVGDMLLAGVETTSHSTGFLLYHLARNKDKEELLYKEITSLLPNKEDRITSSIYDQLRYLKACLKESMRLKPIVGGASRVLPRDAVLAGYQVPAGTLVVVPNDIMTRSERYYKHPDEFLPERWLDREDKPEPYSFLPFGHGPRGCVGRRLAELEVTSLITEIVRNFKVEYHFEDIGFYTKMINTPDKPLRFNFIERSSV